MISVLLLAATASFAQDADPDNAGGATVSERYIGNAEAVSAGQEQYELVCSSCHGVTGEGGRGPSLQTGLNARASGDELFHTIKNGIPGSGMPPSPLEEETVWQITAFVWSLSAPAIRQNVDGNVEAGEALFYGSGGCTDCHMIRGNGGYIGPDLSNLGVTRSVAQIRVSLLDPNERFTEGFDPVILTLKDGTAIRGVAKNHSNYAIQVLGRDGRLYLLNRADVTLEFRESSWMPANYSERLSEAEIQNLLAFLSRQSVRPVETAEGGNLQ
ncbi:MAG TPA: c-type cytochrome [Vicinamibacterales bacterium]|nr:c-type cytochrome [Vicinamibacterales bacterium]